MEAPRRQKMKTQPNRSLLDWANLPKQSRPYKKYTREEVKKHNSRESCWCILFGTVYDLTSFLEYHPGGEAILLKYAGRDMTALFNKYHSWVNWQHLLKGLEIGCMG